MDIKKEATLISHFSSAEKEGFEPPVHCCTTVFKTAAIDHSAISPLQRYNFFIPKNKLTKNILFLFHLIKKQAFTNKTKISKYDLSVKKMKNKTYFYDKKSSFYVFSSIKKAYFCKRFQYDCHDERNKP